MRKADSNMSNKQKLIYLDNAATTRTAPEVAEAMLPYFSEYYGNPSSVYEFSGISKKAVTQAREQIASSIGAKAQEIYFTAGGSESDNWALKAAADALKEKGRHIITSKIEHHAVLHSCEYLEKQGFEVTYLDVDENGVIRLDDLKKAIRPDTILISIMFANNEIGTMEPIREVGQIARERGILFHTDAVQAYGHVPINVDEYQIDMMSASGHKLNGPKGIGFLYIRTGVKIRSFVHGGAQERRRRAGTENVPGIAGLALAAKTIYENLDEKVAVMRALKEHFIEGVTQIENTKIHGMYDETSAPHIISVVFAGIRSEVLLHALEEKGIYVSSGSACSSNHPQVSGVLKGIGADQEYLDATLRFSMSEFTTPEEIDYTLEALKSLVPTLRRYTRH